MNWDKLNGNAILKLTFEFSLLAISYCEELEARRQFVISRQLLRSATSIGANAMEAQNAESRADFFHKFKLVAKEADETEYWLMLCQHSSEYPDCSELLRRVDEIARIVGKILTSSRKSIARPTKG